MSRRKQARPSRANLEEDLLLHGSLRTNFTDQPIATQDDNDTGSEGEESSGGGVCGEEAVDLTSNRSHQDDLDEREPEELPMEEDEEEGIDENDDQEDDEEGSRKQIRNRQDAENNNNFIEGAAASGIFGTPAGTSHVTLEALQNTKVAVAQFAATALAGGADSEAALQDLALLQSTLFTLQHQQVFQLQLISKLQQQLSITHGQTTVPNQTTITTTSIAAAPPTTTTSSSSVLSGEMINDIKENNAGSPSPLIHPKSISSLITSSSPPPSSRSSSHQPSLSPLPIIPGVNTSVLKQECTGLGSSCSTSPISLNIPCVSGIITSSSSTAAAGVTAGVGIGASSSSSSSSITPTMSSGGGGGGGATAAAATTMSHQMPALCSISSSLASSIITNNDPMPLNEPNTLEMLQKRAQEVLDNASQGLLANNLADELAFRSGKSGSRLSPYDSKSAGGRGEPFFKHRCRYCGKVFGSDSALQIHIRSHTGERPFKCNVCGSRFTTKGNLKVHFQRHTAKFPHVKMNPNPIPEHLDKYHPPLLQQLAASGQRPLPSPPPPSSAPPPPPTSSLSSLSSLSNNNPNTSIQSPHHHASFHPTAAHSFLPPQPPLPLTLTLPTAAAPTTLFHRGPIVNQRDDQDLPENLSKPVNLTSPIISIPTAITTMSTKTTVATSITPPRSPMRSPIRSPMQSPLSINVNNSASVTTATTTTTVSTPSLLSSPTSMTTETTTVSATGTTTIVSLPSSLTTASSTIDTINNSNHSGNNNNVIVNDSRKDEIKREQQFSPLLTRPNTSPIPTDDDTSAPIILKKEPEEAIDDTPEDDIDDFEPSSPQSSRRYLDHTSPIANNPINMSNAQSYDDCSMDSKLSGSRIGTEIDADGDIEGDEEMEEQPENLSSRGINSRLCQQTSNYHPGASPASSTASSGSLQTSFAGLLFPTGPPGSHQHQLQQQQQQHQQQRQFSHLPLSANPTSHPNESSMMVDPARDPAIYSNLLPRPGSNDNSWESLIEITKTSETSKLQQLVDNIEHKLTDPNQCVICHRVLSCKSALQMHYRTHTGERPFKCKICGRAFTTKGNLKTHMGVHRAKPPLRVLHQCPVCHKKFTNALVLQQHIRLHTGEPTDLSPEQIQAAEVNDFPPGYPPHPLASFLPQGFPGLHPGPGGGFSLGFPPSRHPGLERPGGLHDGEIDPKALQQFHQQQHQYQQHLRRNSYLGVDDQSEDMDDQDDEDDDRRDDDDRCDDDIHEQKPNPHSLLVGVGGGIDDDNDINLNDNDNERDDVSKESISCFSTSLAALENQVKTVTTMASSGGNNNNTIMNNINSNNLNTRGESTSPLTSPLDRHYNSSEKSTSPPSLVLAGAPLDLTPRASSTPGSVTSTSTPPPALQSLPPLPPPTLQHHPHPFGMFAGLLQAVSSSPSPNNIHPTGAINSVATMNAVSPGGGNTGPGALASLTTSAVLAASSTYNPLGLAVGGPAVRGNTTCNICYKTFACNSALEIHYRSHTKERPFKCTICDRGFSTKNDGTVVRECVCLESASVDDDELIGRHKPSAGAGQRSSSSSKRKRKRRTEEEKTRGRSRSGERWALTSTCAAPLVHLPPLMPPALGLLPSDHVFLGNMKQHMLTHKIRDMPPHLFSDAKPSGPPPNQQPSPSLPASVPQPPLQHSPHLQQQTSPLLVQQNLTESENSKSPMCTDESSLPPPPPPPPPMPPASESTVPAKRSPPETDLPAPKRPSMSNKHLCQVCNKNFSSSSALQIHMRTHTGDKPFRCTVCQKAFTTKGNLKVHMGTHMWTNGASRRGRRMSLDLPPLPITPKDSEFLQRRPDLFYPYLPAPFLNGVQQKLNEISVIQSNNGLPGTHPVNASKYAGLFGTVYAGGGFPLEKSPMTPTNGPLVDGKPVIPSGSMLFQTPSPSHSPGTPSSNTGNQNSASIPPWTSPVDMQHHFEREGSTSRSENNSTPPTSRLSTASAPRGEGLAA